MFENPINRYIEEVNAANEIGEQIKLATTDTDSRAKEIVESSQDGKLAQFRSHRDNVLAQIKEAQEKLKEQETAALEYARAQIPGLEDFDLESAKVEFRERRANANRVKKALLTLMDDDQEAWDALVEEHGITEIIGLSGQRSGATGVKRPRIATATVNGSPVADEKGNVSVTSLTNYVNALYETKVPSSVIRDAMFEAAGTDNLSSLEEGTEISFTVGIGNNDVAFTVTTP